MRHRTTYLALCIAALLLLKAWSAPCQDVTFDRLLQAEKGPNNWITYFRDYRGWRFSPLTQINTTNVKRVVPKWTFDLEGAGLQLMPLVIDGVMYVTNSNHHIFALDAATGKLLWRYRHKLPDDMPSRIWGRWNRRGRRRRWQGDSRYDGCPDPRPRGENG
jgi:glucose dehydrogenase